MNDAQPIKAISVVLPAHNEEDNISRVVLRVVEVFSAWAMDHEIIVVDDGSTDGTAEVLRGLRSRNANLKVITHQKNEGYGAALLSGFKAAEKEWVLMMDADGQFDIEDAFRLLAYASDADIVCGFRKQRRDSFLRRFFGCLGNFFMRSLFGITLKDIKCGFKMLRLAVLKKMISRMTTTTGMINVEMMLLAKLYHFRVKEVGVDHRYRLRGRQKGMRLSFLCRSFLEAFRLKFLLS